MSERRPITGLTSWDLVHPNPYFRGTNPDGSASWQGLNNSAVFEWSPAATPDQVDFTGQHIQLPFVPESPLGLNTPNPDPLTHRAWYRLQFTTPPEWEDKILTVKFGGVDYASKVFREDCGEMKSHEGYGPFSVPVNNHPSSHAIYVMAENLRYDQNPAQPRGKKHPVVEECFLPEATGIEQPVYLLASPFFHLEELKHFPRYFPRTNRAALRGEVQIPNHRQGQKLHIEVTARGEHVVSKDVPVGDKTRFDMSIPKIYPWDNRRDPFWYDVRYVLWEKRGGTVKDLHIVDSEFCLRHLAVHNGRVEVNGDPRQLGLVLYQSFDPLSYYIRRDINAYRQDFNQIGQMFDGVRYHMTRPGPATAYAMRDIFWDIEGRNWGGDHMHEEFAGKVWNEVQEVYDELQLAQPPLVVPQNESPRMQHPDFQRTLWTNVREMIDRSKSSTLAVSVSGFTHAVKETKLGAPRPDMFSVHIYDQDPRVLAQKLRTLRYPDGSKLEPGTNLALFEFGGIPTDFSGFKVNPDGTLSQDVCWGYCSTDNMPANRGEVARRIADMVNILKNLPVALWCYTQWNNTGVEVNGLTDPDAKEKEDLSFALLAQAFRAGRIRD